MSKKVVAGLAVALAAAGTASADVTYTFTSQTWSGFAFSMFNDVGELEGMLTAVSVDAVLEAQAGTTFASDLTLYLCPEPLAAGGVLQVGGWSSLDATQRYEWANGGSTTPGTPVIDTVTLSEPIDISAYPVWIGNGWNLASAWGTWSGTITLHGVNLVPAPGALALLGAGGVLAARRRR